MMAHLVLLYFYTVIQFLATQNILPATHLMRNTALKSKYPLETFPDPKNLLKLHKIGYKKYFKIIRIN